MKRPNREYETLKQLRDVLTGISLLIIDPRFYTHIHTNINHLCMTFKLYTYTLGNGFKHITGLALTPDLLQSGRKSCDGQVGFFHVIVHMNQFGVLVSRR